MEKEFVTYEIALKLKELGFDEKCFSISWSYDKEIEYYHEIWDKLCVTNFGLITNNLIDTNGRFEEDVEIVAVPLYSQIIDWFREKHNIHIQVNCVNWRNGKQFEGYLCKVQTQEIIDKGDYSKYLYLTDLAVTYEEVREQAILKAIELCQKE